MAGIGKMRCSAIEPERVTERGTREICRKSIIKSCFLMHTNPTLDSQTKSTGLIQHKNYISTAKTDFADTLGRLLVSSSSSPALLLSPLIFLVCNFLRS